MLEEVAYREDMNCENSCNQHDGNNQQIISEDRQCDDVVCSEAEQEKKVRKLWKEIWKLQCCDEDGNGSFDYVEISTHDENGNLLSQSTVDSETSLLASFFFDCWR